MVAVPPRSLKVETFPGPGWVDLLLLHLPNKGIFPC